MDLLGASRIKISEGGVRGERGEHTPHKRDARYTRNRLDGQTPANP
eukprot:COSAG05_NODE_26115_length_190_cov_119.549451_1_plen_45_part_01